MGCSSRRVVVEEATERPRDREENKIIEKKDRRERMSKVNRDDALQALCLIQSGG